MAEPRSGRKSASAFRTISEASEILEVPQHVLRFWETRFSLLKPMKRGGRRYYRPEDIQLLTRIKTLLYDEGYTIKGAQKHLREQRSGKGSSSPVSLEANEAGEDLQSTQDAAESGEEAPLKPASPESQDPLDQVLNELEELRRIVQSALKK